MNQFSAGASVGAEESKVQPDRANTSPVDWQLEESKKQSSVMCLSSGQKVIQTGRMKMKEPQEHSIGSADPRSPLTDFRLAMSPQTKLDNPSDGKSSDVSLEVQALRMENASLKRQVQEQQRQMQEQLQLLEERQEILRQIVKKHKQEKAELK